VSSRSRLALALYEAGRLEESQERFERLAQDFPDNPRYEATLGMVAAKRGNRAEAMRVAEWLAGLDRPGERTRSLWRAMIAAQLGEREAAVRLLEGYFGDVGFNPWTLHNSAFDSLRDYPPFLELLKPKG
jgi:predicted Zn-dependent protease